jgi:hypothetical protein
MPLSAQGIGMFLIVLGKGVSPPQERLIGCSTASRAWAAHQGVRRRPPPESRGARWRSQNAGAAPET